MRTNRGFTLIELLVVITIIGITLGFALLSFGDFGQSRRLSMAADRFVNTVHLAQQQAILESSTLGILMGHHSYQVYRFQRPGNWAPISNQGIFAAQHFPDHTQLKMSTSEPQKPNRPAIIISSSGDLSAFKLIVGADTTQNSTTTIVGRHDGFVSIIKPTSS